MTGLAGHQISGVHLSAPQHCITGVLSHTQLLPGGPVEPNSGPAVCVAHTLPAELSPPPEMSVAPAEGQASFLRRWEGTWEWLNVFLEVFHSVKSVAGDLRCENAVAPESMGFKVTVERGDSSSLGTLALLCCLLL